MQQNEAGRLLKRIGPSLGAAAVLAGIELSGIAQRLDLSFYDLITNLRPAPSARDLPITIIGIEEGDIRRHGWPIDDRLLCQALDRLTDAGATAVGLDIYRDRGVGPDQACLRERFARDPRLVSVFNVANAIQAIPGTPASRRGYNDLSLDPDGTLRRDLVHVTGQDEATVALPLRLVEVAEGNRQLRRQLETGRLRDAWLQADAGGYHREADAGLGLQRMLIFRQPGSFRTFSLSTLLAGQVPPSDIAGRIVIIGSTAPSLRDLFMVPMSHFRGGTVPLSLSGAEVHALRVASLLELQQGQRSTGWLMPGWGNLLLTLLAAGGGLALGEAFRSLRSSVFATTGVAVLLSGSLAALLLQQIWIGTSMPLLALLLLAAAAWLRRGAASQLHSRQVQRLLGQATSPAVAQLLWDKRDQLLRDGIFEGRQLPVTVLFTDLANFTTVSEHLTPAELTAWLNRCLSVCIPAVIQRNGMVNKFTGDGMMAVFGVPVGKDPAADARAAVEASLAIREGLDELNTRLAQEGMPGFRLRIGIHSGEALAGSIGSSDRLEYGVIGDTVNCASRLESLEKQRHDGVTRILISSVTRDLLDADLVSQRNWLEWGPLQVKGRDEPLDIFELQDGQRTGNASGQS
jgi:adenylate cyclase